MGKPKLTGLGRGLDAILVDSDYSPSGDSITSVRINDVEPNREQPRKQFPTEELEALSDSIVKYGVISPITVRRVGERYVIIAGERRWRAARMAGLSEIPVIIISADDKKAAEIALVENIQRSDLNPVEEAQAYAALIDQYGLTQEEVAEQIGKSRSSVTNSLRLLDLPDAVLSMLAAGKLSSGHAKVLLGIKDGEKLKAAAEKVAEGELSVRETEKLVKQLLAGPKPEKELPPIDYTKALETAIQEKIGRTVKIKQNGVKSSITIGFSDNNDLETVLRLLCGDEFVNSL
ncbi:MAG: ParB/RepB/Spo0J family partition protein [Eubacteriales bacterium]|nr:ParB/RepB/Spo0J family partition protein [Eubacteriales bacterium]MCI6971533.1 ParB/RepB/Spo0J family partition protein [Eubacterium sp.]MDD7572689.1 ParB/RepB/Spo0J family partition protein [Eubacteriales bacterium]MDY5355681.1 ParB/RepB/Spo0J family partition protein [Eubacteriales bacterium]